MARSVAKENPAEAGSEISVRSASETKPDLHTRANRGVSSEYATGKNRSHDSVRISYINITDAGSDLHVVFRINRRQRCPKPPIRRSKVSRWIPMVFFVINQTGD